MLGFILLAIYLRSLLPTIFFEYKVLTFKKESAISKENQPLKFSNLIYSESETIIIETKCITR